MCSRIGLGNVRHLDTGLLWIQTHIDRKELELRKEKGKNNVADLGTKDLAEADMRKHLERCGLYESTGRHELALRAALGTSTEFAVDHAPPT